MQRLGVRARWRGEWQLASGEAAAAAVADGLKNVAEALAIHAGMPRALVEEAALHWIAARFRSEASPAGAHTVKAREALERALAANPRLLTDDGDLKAALDRG